MNAKLAALLAELDKEIVDYETVTLTVSEYDLLREALREREGMVMVPREPTEKMYLAAKDCVPRTSLSPDFRRTAYSVYTCMLAAAEGE